MRVVKRSVEQFVIGDVAIERPEALTLHEELGRALGMPSLKSQGCSDRYSHGMHLHGSELQLVCSGRNFDAT